MRLVDALLLGDPVLLDPVELTDAVADTDDDDEPELLASELDLTDLVPKPIEGLACYFCT